MVLVPEPSKPSNKSFWTLFCSRYSGTDLTENAAESSFDPGGFSGGVGNLNNEHMRRVDAYISKHHTANIWKIDSQVLVQETLTFHRYIIKR